MTHILNIKLQILHFILAKRSRMIWVEKGGMPFYKSLGRLSYFNY
jgi:hypothetical protein